MAATSAGVISADALASTVWILDTCPWCGFDQCARVCSGGAPPGIRPGDATVAAWTGRAPLCTGRRLGATLASSRDLHAARRRCFVTVWGTPTASATAVSAFAQYLLMPVGRLPNTRMCFNTDVVSEDFPGRMSAAPLIGDARPPDAKSSGDGHKESLLQASGGLPWVTESPRCLCTTGGVASPVAASSIGLQATERRDSRTEALASVHDLVEVGSQQRCRRGAGPRAGARARPGLGGRAAPARRVPRPGLSASLALRPRRSPGAEPSCPSI